MVTKKEQDDVKIGPKGAIMIAVITIAIGLLAWTMALQKPEKGIASRDLQTGQVMEQIPSNNHQLPIGDQTH